jgi:hypothetical protein
MERTYVHASTLLAAVLLFSPLLRTNALSHPTIVTHKVPSQAEPIVLVQITKQSFSDPTLDVIALIENGQFNAPRGVKVKDMEAFATKYLPNGRRFFVVFGGGAAGTIDVASTGLGCNERVYATGPFAAGSLGSDRIHGAVRGLATNSDRIARSEIWRRAPSADERAAAVDLAKEFFTAKGVPSTQLAKMETINLTAIDIEADNKAELVGAFKAPVADKEKPPHYLFLIAEGEGKNFKAAYSSYGYLPKSKIYSSGEETLIDYIDLDRDGLAEIISSYTGLTDAGYRIYRKTNGQWQKIYQYAAAICDSEEGG